MKSGLPRRIFSLGTNEVERYPPGALVRSAVELQTRLKWSLMTMRLFGGVSIGQRFGATPLGSLVMVRGAAGALWTGSWCIRGAGPDGAEVRIDLHGSSSHALR